MKETHPETSPTDQADSTLAVAIELEDITDELWHITKEAETLTEGHIDRNFSWMRQLSKELPDGSDLLLTYTVGRLDNNYASVIQEIPALDGGSRLVERHWSNVNPADSDLQTVKSTRIRPGKNKIEDLRRGFNDKDINRLKKLIGLFKEEEPSA